MRHKIALAILVVGGFALQGAAQENIQQIKQQIAILQQQLEAMENQPPPKRNVTQIGAARSRKVETGLAVRIYDLGDLFAIAPPYPAQISSDLKPGMRTSLFDMNSPGVAAPATSGMGGGGMGGMGGGFFSVFPNPATALASSIAGQAGAAGSVKSSQDEMIQVIKETISPDLWKEGGKITKLGNAFVISADDDTHQQIESLLNLFRARWGTLRTISVRAWWLSLSAAEIRTLLDSPTEKVTDDGPVVFGLVGDKAWGEILQIWQQPAGNDAHRLKYQATLTCYNGQTVNAQSGSQGLTVTNMETVMPQVESGNASGKIGFNPDMTVIQEGLAYQMTPITNVSGKTVLLDIHSRLTLPGSHDDTPAAGKSKIETIFPDDIVRPIDRRRVNIHRLSTTARVPVDRPYLIGGLSLPTPETEGLQLYLFVKVSVQELRNDQEPAKPADKDEPKKDEKPAE